MRSYSAKVFDKDSRLSRMTDSRVDPRIPLGAVLSTWQWGLARLTPSTERIGDLLLDERWRAIVGLKREDGGSPDRAAEILDGLSIDEGNEMMIEDFFIARRAGILTEDGPYGKRCAAVDLNELFKSEKVHCAQCQVREKTVADAKGGKRTVLEYYHQAVALTWVSGQVPFVIGWEVLAPGEGELTVALRLLKRLLPRLRKSLDFVLGDALYCCRPFFEVVCGAGLEGMAISSRNTEMDEEIELLMRTDRPRIVQALNVALWEMGSEAWQQALKRNLRVIHCERRYEAPAWKHERKELRVITSAPIDILPSGQGWKVGCSRWTIENATFNLLTRDYSLTHNYHHCVAAIVGLLAMRSFARFLTLAYWQNATARSRNAPKRFVQWFEEVVIEGWVRYLDQALKPDIPQG
ncbi:MAG: transposase [Acidobacteriota bacterium]